jgi:hypothetical protein
MDRRDPDRLDARPIAGLVFAARRRRRLQIVEIVSCLVASENLRGYKLRADISGAVAQDELAHGVWLGRPKFFSGNRDRQSRGSGRPSENEGVNPLRAGDAGIGDLPGTFFDDDAVGGATGQQHGHKGRSEDINAHRR